MSVVVKRLRSTSMEVYVKGAPEVMADICVKDSCAYPNIILLQALANFVQSQRIMMIFSRTIPSEGIV